MGNSFDMMGSPEATALLKDKATLAALLTSPDAKRLMELLSQNDGKGLKEAASKAMKGDSADLVGMVQQVMSSKEGADVVDRIQKSASKK